jgi:RND family efflux transporter MFP subunit
VPLSAEGAARAGIVVAPVVAGASASELRLPGLVEPNAYRQVVVTPLVSGRLTRVTPALGEQVRRGQTLAVVYSPELAEAQTRYVSARALLNAHDRELQRTQKLVEIGAASRQELERIHADHAAQTSAVKSARAQLELLGVPSARLDALATGAEISAETNVPAPIDGIVTERAANIGLNVDPATKLFTIVDLSTVWVVADLFERDMARVRVGADARVTTAAYPDQILRGRVSYIDPQLSPETRTAKLRVELANPGGTLRLGMFADVTIAAVGAGASAPMIPRSAVQAVGSRTVVYLANAAAPGTFIEREVRLGATTTGGVEVLSGVQAGDAIVVEGSFFVRAERERLGLRPAPGPAPADGQVQSARIEVTDQGFVPASVTLRAGAPVRLTFVRTSDKTCATEVMVPSLNVKRPLPLNQPVAIDVTAPQPGDIAFACGMNMWKGVVVVR